jgi:hypothetical protein
MPTFLRFRREEFHAIARLCRPVHLRDAFFPAFKAFLVESLTDACPALADRIAGFHRYQLGILFEYLKERRHAEALAGGKPGDLGLTAAEHQAVARAAATLVVHHRFLSCFRDCLVRYFRFGQGSPELAEKLARLSDRQVEQLCEQVRQHRV